MIVECEKCSSKLLFGKYDKAISWCPNCEGLEVIPNTQAVQMIRNDIIKLNEEINKLIITYDKESLLISLYVTREGMLHDNSLDLGLFMTITELIQTVIKMTNNGSQKCIPMSDEFQNILQYAEEFRESKIIMRLLNQGWGKLIKIKKNMMSEYCYKFDDVIKLRGQNAVVFDNNDWTNQWKFTYEWHQVLNNLEENGLYARTTKIDNSIDFKKINEFWNSIRVKIGLELAVGDNKILEIDTLKKIQGKDIISYLRKLDELIEKFPFEITFSEKMAIKIYCKQPVDVVTFLLPLVKTSYVSIISKILFFHQYLILDV
ncbi:MAG: hypothetical protein H7A34_07760 [bacterium]|nr:hypothetical protein [bacterium]